MEHYLTDRITGSRTHGPFDSRMKAVATMEQHHKETGVALRIEAVPTPDELAAARAARLAEMTVAPWQRLPAWFPTLDEHYAACEDNDSGYLWFVESPTDILTGRRTHAAASRYLSKFCNPALAPNEISALTQRLIAWQRGYSDMVITDDQDTIIEAYHSKCIGSCMQGARSTRDEWNPLRVYGGESDLHLAFVRDRHNVIVARAIVNSLNNQYINIYGAEDARAHLHEQLTTAGYTRSRMAYAGAKINLIQLGNSRYAMAYIDGDITTCNRDGVLGGAPSWLHTQISDGYTYAS